MRNLATSEGIPGLWLWLGLGLSFGLWLRTLISNTKPRLIHNPIPNAKLMHKFDCGDIPLRWYSGRILHAVDHLHRRLAAPATPPLPEVFFALMRGPGRAWLEGWTRGLILGMLKFNADLRYCFYLLLLLFMFFYWYCYRECIQWHPIALHSKFECLTHKNEQVT